MSPSRRTLLIVTSVAVVLAGASSAAWHFHAHAPDTAVVENRTLEEVVELSGSVEAAHSVTLRAQTSGVVQARPVAQGAKAKANAVLLALDPTQARLNLAQSLTSSQATLAQDQTQLANATRSREEVEARQAITLADLSRQVDKARTQLTFQLSELKRTHGLAVDGAVSGQSEDSQANVVAQARTDLNVAQASLDKMRSGQEVVSSRNAESQARTALATARTQGAAAVALAQKSLDDTRLLAPFNGTVTAWQVDLGDGVSAGQAVATFQDLDDLRLSLPVDELDLPKMRPGGPVTVAFDAYPDRLFQGKIVEVERASQLSTGNVPIFPVKVQLANPDGSLRPGMTGNAKVLVATLPHAIAVPLAAIRRENSKLVVTVYTPAGRQETRPIEPGTYTLDYLEVKSGLKAGERVVVGAAKATP